MEDRVRVLIVDDSLTIRAMLEQVIGGDVAIEVIGGAANADDAMRMIERHRPDVVTLDIAMPGTSGMELLDRIVSRGIALPVMVSSRYDRAEEAGLHGALGFIDKARLLANVRTLTRMIKAAARGKLHPPRPPKSSLALRPAPAPGPPPAP